MSEPVKGPIAQETEEAKSQSVEETGEATNQAVGIQETETPDIAAASVPFFQSAAAAASTQPMRGPITQNTEEANGQSVEETGEARTAGVGIQETETPDISANRALTRPAFESAAAQATSTRLVRGPISEDTGSQSVQETRGNTEEPVRTPPTETWEGNANRDTTRTVLEPPCPRPAFELTATHGTTSGRIAIENPYLAGAAIVGGLGALVCIKLDSEQLVKVAQGFGKAAGVAAGVSSVGSLVYLWVTKREQTQTAIRRSLEGERAVGAHARDPQVENIRYGSLLVSIRCHSQESLVKFIQDYNSGILKQRLMGELSKIGLKGDLILSIENREELQKYLKTTGSQAKFILPRRSQSGWSRNQVQRLGIEKDILTKYFRDGVTWINPREREDAKVESRLTTSYDNQYTLRIYIPPDYPNSCPTLVVRNPRGPLKKRDGSEMNWSAGRDHTHDSQDGFTVICHFRPSLWTGANTLYQVFMKGLIWLEAYEGHLHSGKPLSTYLRECIY